jgi:hypothetical protein
VKKHVLTAPNVDKPKTLFGLLLDRAFCHFNPVPKKMPLRCCPTQLVQAAQPQRFSLNENVDETKGVSRICHYERANI